LAVEKLLLSGTPFRTDGKEIPFVSYDGQGYSAADFRYDYPDALEDDVVRWLVFNYEKGSADVAVDGVEQTLSLNSETSDDDAAFALRNVLNASGDYVSSVIQQANKQLLSIREYIPDAAAMAACMDTRHAEHIADVINRVTGQSPAIIVSDDEVATHSVSKFAKSRDPWLVSIKQVSEGTDIKRLMVLCYLTHFATELFFRQLIGRVSRRRNDDDEEAYVFIPADPRLIAFAKNIENAQAVAAKQMEDKIIRESQEPTSPPKRCVAFLGSEHSGSDLVFIGNAAYDPGIAGKIKELASQSGLTNEQAARAWNAIRKLLRAEPDIESAKPLEAQEKMLRQKITRLVKVLAKITGMHWKEIHKLYPRTYQMTVEQLQSKHDDLLRRIREARR
jgi:type I site-specific restriction endonuclease